MLRPVAEDHAVQARHLGGSERDRGDHALRAQAQPDGSYHGDHQWFYGTCQLDPTPGLTAWRVLTTASGGFPAGVPEQPQRRSHTADDRTGRKGVRRHVRMHRLGADRAGADRGRAAAQREHRLDRRHRVAAQRRRVDKIHRRVTADDADAAALRHHREAPEHRALRAAGRAEDHPSEPEIRSARHGHGEGRRQEAGRHPRVAAAQPRHHASKVARGHYKTTVEVTTVLDHHLSATRRYHSCHGTTA